MRIGQPVGITVDAWPGKPIEGRVDSFAPASGAQFSLLPPENATGNFTKIVQRVPVRIAVPTDNPLSGMLRPGLSVEAAVDTRAPGTGPLLAGGVFGAAAAPDKGRLAGLKSDDFKADRTR
jgi:membrane fusion protein (multidrug efflux system)